jgi:hypothetical protein
MRRTYGIDRRSVFHFVDVVRDFSTAKRPFSVAEHDTRCSLKTARNSTSSSS